MTLAALMSLSLESFLTSCHVKLLNLSLNLNSLDSQVLFCVLVVFASVGLLSKSDRFNKPTNETYCFVLFCLPLMNPKGLVLFGVSN